VRENNVPGACAGCPRRRHNGDLVYPLQYIETGFLAAAPAQCTLGAGIHDVTAAAAIDEKSGHRIRKMVGATALLSKLTEKLRQILDRNGLIYSRVNCGSLSDKARRAGPYRLKRLRPSGDFFDINARR
jgi:hypothetical protein